MCKLPALSSEPAAPVRLHLASLLPVIFILLTTSGLLRAQVSPATVTTNASQINNSAMTANEVFPLKATVTINGAPVTLGTVTFFEGATMLGTVNVNSNGVAALSYLLPPTNQSSYGLTAHYNGSTQAGPATSTPGFFSAVTSVAVTLSSTGDSSGYNVVGAVTSTNIRPPTGSLRFVDMSNGVSLGFASLTGNSYVSPITVAPTLGYFDAIGRIETVSPTTVDGQFALQVNLSNADGATTPVTSQPFGPSSDTYQMLAVGDFNNDGITDVVMQDMTSDVLTVLLSQGNGQFSIAGQLTIADTTSAVVGDMNNDGRLDLIAASSSGMQFYAGDGAGHLAAGQAIAGSAMGAALVGDYNNDGHLDFFSYTPGSTNSFAGTSLYLGAGDGTTFNEQPQSNFGGYAPPSDVNSMIGGRFCGQTAYNIASGHVDIAYVDTSTVTILCGDGAGNFAAPKQFNIGSHTLVRLTSADISASGNPSIIAFVQDQTSPAPWNMVVLANISSFNGGQYTVSAEASTDSSGVNFPNTPIVFSTPAVGEPLTTSSPLAAITPFIAERTGTTATATISNVTLPPGIHPIATTFASVDSNTLQLAGSLGGYEGPSLQNNLGFLGTAKSTNGILQLTDGGLWEAGSAFANTLIGVQSFASTFTFQLINAQADGFTFTVQHLSPQAIGGNGGNLGYGGASPGYSPLTKSVALKFDLFDNAGEGNNSIGVFTNGAVPTTPAVDLTGSGVDLHSGDVMKAELIYDGQILHVTLTDTNTGSSFQHDFPIDIPTSIGSKTAYVGFTGATGGLGATQQILSWTYEQLPYYPNFTATPALQLDGGAVLNTSAQTLHLLDSNTPNEASGAWFTDPVPITKFTNDFTFVGSAALADGLTFTIQNSAFNALGPSGGGLGYGPDVPGAPVGIGNSMAIKFDLFDNTGEGINSTGIFTAGDSPTVPAIDLGGTGIDLHNGNPINVHMVYDGSTITMTLTDTVTQATWLHYFYGVDLPTLVGSNTAYVGFTGGTGGLTANEDIRGWTYLPSNTITSPIKTY
jgi:hypothetical protein